MAKHLDWLVVELERQAKDRLSDEDTRELVREVEAHIDAAVRARVDLGMELEAAEKEAVEAFGEPKRIVDEIARADRPKAGFIFQHGCTASGGPLLLAGFGVFGKGTTIGRDTIERN
jgi:hypothetical protein